VILLRNINLEDREVNGMKFPAVMKL